MYADSDESDDGLDEISSESLPALSSTKTKAVIHDFFTYDPITDVNTCKVAKCKGQIKGRNPSNLRKHLEEKKIHQGSQELKEYLEKKAKNEKDKESKQAAAASSMSSTKKKDLQQPTLEQVSENQFFSGLLMCGIEGSVLKFYSHISGC